MTFAAIIIALNTTTRNMHFVSARRGGYRVGNPEPDDTAQIAPATKWTSGEGPPEPNAEAKQAALAWRRDFGR